MELGSEWGDIANKIALDVMKSLANFRNQARGLTFNELKKRVIGFSDNQIKWLNTKIKQDKVSDNMINMWDRWDTNTKAKGLSLEENGRKLGDELIKRNDINSKLATARRI